jgi:hypothetical protein
MKQREAERRNIAGRSRGRWHFEDFLTRTGALREDGIKDNLYF